MNPLTEAEFKKMKFDQALARYKKCFKAGIPFYSEEERGELGSPIDGCRRKSQMMHSERGLTEHVLRLEHDSKAIDNIE